MQLSITEQELEVIDSLCGYIFEKMERIEQYFNQLFNAHLMRHIQKQTHKTEVTLYVPATINHANLKLGQRYAVINALIDRLEIQDRKYKAKQVGDHRSEGGVRVNLESQVET